MQYNGCFSKILYTYDEITKRINELALEINSYYKSFQGEDIIVIGILDGSLVFVGHLLPKLDYNLIFKTAKVSLYGSKTFARKEDMIFNLNFDESILRNKKVLILEDLLDTGMTLDVLVEKILQCGAQEVKVCVLFKKNLKNHKQFPVDWIGLDVPNEWVAGFGIDSREKYRNYKHLGVVKIEKR